MSDYILVKDELEKWHRAKGRDLPDEATLQVLICDHPEVLPLDDLGDDTPPFLVVGREAELANGYADVIGVDHTGLITIVECKLDRNQEVKRKVVGQILSYAAHLWGMSYEQFEADLVRAYFDSQECHRHDLATMALDDAMEQFRQEQISNGDWSKESFRENLTRNLKEGRFRLVIVVDKVNDELRRTVEYLNACTTPGFQFLCAELRYFATERRTELLIPTLVGKPFTSELVVPSPRWTAERFFAALYQECGQEVQDIARKLLEWCQDKQHCDEVRWGNGAHLGSFSVYARSHNGHMVNLLSMWTDGTMSINSGNARPYVHKDKRPEWQERMRKSGFEPAKNSVDGFSSLPMKSLADPGKHEAFLNAMQWAINQLRSPSDSDIEG
jgi:hypothetical protein